MKQVRIAIYTMMVCLFVILVTTSCVSKELDTNTHGISLAGKLIVKSFADANNKKEEVYILILDKPIDVKKDDFGGPDKNVTEVQLAIINEEADRIAKKQINKEIRVIGFLYHGHTAHHHTKVLMAVQEIMF